MIAQQTYENVDKTKEDEFLNLWDKIHDPSKNCESADHQLSPKPIKKLKVNICIVVSLFLERPKQIVEADDVMDAIIIL